MGAGLQKKPDCARAGDLLGLVRNLDQKSRHGTYQPNAWFTATQRPVAVSQSL
jgi:hypothetical protein